MKKLLILTTLTAFIFLLNTGCNRSDNFNPITPIDSVANLILNIDSSYSIILNGELNQRDSFMIHATVKWTVTIVPDTLSWLQLNVVQGSGDRMIIATTKKENNTNTSRTAQIKIISADVNLKKSYNLTVIQRVKIVAVEPTDPPMAFTSITFTSPYTTKLGYFSTNGSMQAPMNLDSVKARKLLPQIDLTFFADGNGQGFGFMDPAMRSRHQYYDIFYDSLLSVCVETIFYRTTLNTKQFDTARKDMKKIDQYFAAPGVMKLSKNQGYTFPDGSAVFLETVYPTTTVISGNVMAFQNKVSGKKGLINIRTDQYTAWPLSTWNTKVDIIRQK